MTTKDVPASTKFPTRIAMNWNEDTHHCTTAPDRVPSFRQHHLTSSIVQRSSTKDDPAAATTMSQQPAQRQWLDEASLMARTGQPQARPIPRELLFRSRKAKTVSRRCLPKKTTKRSMDSTDHSSTNSSSSGSSSSNGVPAFERSETAAMAKLLDQDNFAPMMIHDGNESLDTWQRGFTAFITTKSTHRFAWTGAQIARRRLSTWGRQFYHREDDFGKERKILMVHLKGNVAISFATNETTIRMGQWLAKQRRAFQMRPPPPPALAPPTPGLDWEANDAAIRTAMKQTFVFMKGTFRFKLLEELGIDLSILPGQTLIQSCAADDDHF